MPCFPWFICHPKSDYVLRRNLFFSLCNNDPQPADIWDKIWPKIEGCFPIVISLLNSKSVDDHDRYDNDNVKVILLLIAIFDTNQTQKPFKSLVQPTILFHMIAKTKRVENILDTTYGHAYWRHYIVGVTIEESLPALTEFQASRV